MTFKSRVFHELVFNKINEFVEGNDNFLDLHHPVYYLSIKDLLETKSLEKAKMLGCRAFGTGEDGEKGVYTIRFSNDDDDHQYGGFHFGDAISEQKTVLNKNKHNVQLDNLEHAFLNIHSLKLHAIWFRGDVASNDYFYPLIPRFHDLEPRLYSEPEFLKIIIDAATQMAQIKTADHNSGSLAGG